MIHPLSEVKSKEIGSGTFIWQFAVILDGAKIGKDCNINCHTFIESDVHIGNRVTIKPGVYIWNGITIEDDVMIGPNATFTNDKLPRSKNKDFKLIKTLIKHGASIGANSTIICGIEVGEFALVGAGAVVTKNVPPRALVVGNPAKITGWLNESGTKMEKIGEIYIDENNSHWKVVNNKLTKLDENTI